MLEITDLTPEPVELTCKATFIEATIRWTIRNNGEAVHGPNGQRQMLLTVDVVEKRSLISSDR